MIVWLYWRAASASVCGWPFRSRMRSARMRLVSLCNSAGTSTRERTDAPVASAPPSALLFTFDCSCPAGRELFLGASAGVGIGWAIFGSVGVVPFGGGVVVVPCASFGLLLS